MSATHHRVIARSEATKQSSWIAPRGEAALAMTMAGKSAGRAAVAALRALIWLYQKTISPALSVVAPTCGCRFAPTCSHYAQEALREHGLLRGLALAARRLAKCGPWHEGGIDRVPARKFSCEKVRPATPAGRPLFTAHRSLS